MYEIKKSFCISCSHRLNNNSLSGGENKNIFGKCNNLPSHGHNYKIILHLKSKTLKNGMIVNFNKIKKVFMNKIDEKFDHKFLNDCNDFKDIIPTAENMCKVFYNILKHDIKQLYKIEIYETETASALYYEDDNNG